MSCCSRVRAGDKIRYIPGFQYPVIAGDRPDVMTARIQANGGLTGEWKDTRRSSLLESLITAASST